MKDVTEIELVLFNFGRRTDARKKMTYNPNFDFGAIYIYREFKARSPGSNQTAS